MNNKMNNKMNNRNNNAGSPENAPRFSPKYEQPVRKAMGAAMFDEFKAKNPQFFAVNAQAPPLTSPATTSPQKGKAKTGKRAVVQPKYEILPAPNNPLKHVNLAAKQMAKVAIDDLRKSVICGTVVSDTSLGVQPKYKNARMQNRHTTRQSEWFFWKWMVCLPEFHYGYTSLMLENADGYQENSPLLPGEDFLGKLQLTTRATPELTKLSELICVNPGPRKQKIQRFWLNHMTDYFLMTIWLDDGSLTNGRQGVICWDATPPECQQIFVDYLGSVWKVNARVINTGNVMSNGKNAHNIVFLGQDDLLNFLRIVAPIIPIREMLYKVQFVPVNTQSNMSLLQRWASEVTALVKPEFRDEMKAFYDKKIEEFNL